MIRTITVSVLTLAVLSTTLVFAGCQTSGAQPNTTGAPSAAERWHYTDDKGRFRPDLAAESRPLR
jgi:hypothetical protein